MRVRLVFASALGQDPLPAFRSAVCAPSLIRGRRWQHAVVARTHRGHTQVEGSLPISSGYLGVSCSWAFGFGFWSWSDFDGLQQQRPPLW